MRQLLADFHASVEETLTRLLTAEEFLRDLTLDSSADRNNAKRNGRHRAQQRQSSRLEQSTGDCVDGQQNAGESDDEHSIDDIPIDELDSLLDKDVETVKSLFHRHYQFVCELNDFASKINDIFKEGQGLIRHPRNICTFEEKRTIESQIHLLNERYKRLLNKATDRQSKLHEALMTLQKKEMDNLKAWLISAEDRLSTLVSIAHDIPSIFKQLEEYQQLKKELDQQLDTVNSLSSCVVVIDEDDEEGRGDEATSDFEGQLNALSEKWSHVINFIDERGSILEHITNNHNALLSEETKFNDWIEKLSKNLDEMEEMSRQEDIVNITSSSSPGTSVISELIRRLQSLEQEMESQHIHYSSIVDEGQKLLDFLENNSDAFQDVHNRLENLTEIWDQVVQRMENLGVALTKAAKRAQSKMTATTNTNLPYANTTKPLPPSNIRPPSNITATKTAIQSEVRPSSANQTNFSTETQSSSSSTTSSINNSNKKIRLDSWRVKEWQRELENVSTWLGRIEDDLGLDDEGNGAVVWEELEVEEQQILLEDTEIAVESQRIHVDSVIEEGKKIISALTSSGETSATTKKLSDTVDAVEERWASVKEELDHKRIKIRTASELHRLTGEAESMKRILFNHQKWLQGAEAAIDSNSPGKHVDVEKLVDQSRVRTRTMQLQNKKIEKMKQVISMVSDDDPDPVVQESIKDVRSFISFWESINERNNRLVEKIKSRAKDAKGELSPSSTRTPLVVSPDVIDGDASPSPLPMIPSPIFASSNRQEQDELSLSPSLKETSPKTIDDRVSPSSPPPPLPPHNRPPVPPRPPHRPYPSHQQQQHQDNSQSPKGYSLVTSRQDSREKEKEKVDGEHQSLRMKHEESLERRSRDDLPPLPSSSRDKLISASHELDEVKQEDHEESTLVKQHKQHQQEKIQRHSHPKKDDDGDQKEKEEDKNVTRNSSSLAQVSRGIVIKNDETEGRRKDEVSNQQQQQHRENVQQELERRKDEEDNDSSPASCSSLGDPGHEVSPLLLFRLVVLCFLCPFCALSSFVFPYSLSFRSGRV